MPRQTSSARSSASPAGTRGPHWAPIRFRSRSRSRSRRWFLSAPADPKPAIARRPRLLLVGSVVYLAIIFGVMLWQGISIEPEWVLLALLVIAIALGRGRTFVA